MINERKIWNKLIYSGMTKAGTAGMMGNLYAESLLNPKNLQNSYEKSLGYTDESYTSAVDSGKYTNFVNDSAGYGLAQWTFWVRKQALLNFAKSQNKSIGDLDMQLDFLIKELKEDYAYLWSALCKTDDVKAASDAVMLQFERPADVSEPAKTKRYEFSKKYYNMFASATSKIPSTELVQEILAGKWGNGDERKSRLTDAGYNYDEVQSMVNNVINQDGGIIKSPNGLQVTLNVDDYTYSGILEKI